MKKGFTLAEVLITLTVIGVVAALTLPSVIQSFQKHVFYTQFRKAATQLENAIKMYEIDNGCVGNISDCLSNEHNILLAEDIVKYFNVAEKITSENNSKYNVYNSDYVCWECLGTPCAFITSDGMLFNPYTDEGAGNGGMVDVNGPNKGPNKLGRDIFVYYMPRVDGIYTHELIWSGNESSMPNSAITASPCDMNGDALGCAAKLLREGKMNY